MATDSVLKGGGRKAPAHRFEVGREILSPPRELNAHLARIGGRNIYGEPNFRVVWGWSRLAWLGGKFDYLPGSPIATMLEPKYAPHDRWYVEAWYPASRYGTREGWDMAFTKRVEGVWVQELGPYPDRGDYEYLTRIQTFDGKYAGLTPSRCDLIINIARHNQQLRHGDRREHYGKVAEEKLRADEAHDDAVLNDIPWATYKKPHVVVPQSFRGAA